MVSTRMPKGRLRLIIDVHVQPLRLDLGKVEVLRQPIEGRVRGAGVGVAIGALVIDLASHRQQSGAHSHDPLGGQAAQIAHGRRGKGNALEHGASGQVLPLHLPAIDLPGKGAGAGGDGHGGALRDCCFHGWRRAKGGRLYHDEACREQENRAGARYHDVRGSGLEARR